MKKARIIGLGIVLCIFMALIALLQINAFSAFAATTEDKIPYSVKSL